MENITTLPVVTLGDTSQTSFIKDGMFTLKNLRYFNPITHQFNNGERISYVNLRTFLGGTLYTHLSLIEVFQRLNIKTFSKADMETYFPVTNITSIYEVGTAIYIETLTDRMSVNINSRINYFDGNVIRPIAVEDIFNIWRTESSFSKKVTNFKVASGGNI